MMLPIVLDLARVPVALIGRDAQALKRLRQLEADGVPRVRIFSDAPSDALRAYAGARLIERLPAAADLAGSRVVYVADFPPEEAGDLATAATVAGALVNVEDQRGWCDFQEGRPDGDGILLKVGVHHGPSIAINNGGRLDYFGTTVNMAARVQAQASGGDVVLTAQLADDPDVKKFLIAQGLRSEESRAWLKGLQGEHRLLRIRLGG